ncbi:MAG: hypothetical protein ABIL22_01620, partial [candidate division WOR-3 bacterium]
SESNWSSLVGSGDTVAMSHFYNKEGRYEIRAKAKDIQNAESDWSEPHILNIGTEIFWTKEYGGNLDDYGYAITISLDNCYVIAGATNSYGAGGYDVYLIKIDTTGGIVWEKTYGGSGDDYGYSVRTMNDGGFIIAGMTKSFGDENGDLYLIKVDAQGNLVWQKNYGGAYADYGYDLTISPDGYAITGMTGSSGAGSGDVWLLKTNFNGDTVWTKTFGGIDLECGNSIQLCNDNGYIITGYTYSLGANGDVYLVKTDANGEVLWTRNYGGNGQDMGNMVKETADNGYVVVGGNGNVYVLKIDNSGNRVWEKTYGTNYTDNGYAIEQLSDGKYYVVGSAGVNGSDLYYLCLDEAGNLIKEKNYGDFQYEYGRFLLIDGSTAIIGGYRLNNLMRNNVYVIKIKR